MKQKVIGVFELGYENVQLVLREGIGGEFYLFPEDTIARIKVGGDHGDWRDVANCLFQ